MDRLHRCRQRGQRIRVSELLSASCKDSLLRGQILHVVKEKTLLVDKIEVLLGFLDIHALVNHFLADPLHNAAARRSRAKAQVLLVGEFLAGDVKSPEYSRQRDDAGSLDVVIEYWIPVDIPVQQHCLMASSEILEVEVQVREQPIHKLHELVNAGVVLLAPPIRW